MQVDPFLIVFNVKNLSKKQCNNNQVIITLHLPQKEDTNVKSIQEKKSPLRTKEQLHIITTVKTKQKKQQQYAHHAATGYG